MLTIETDKGTIELALVHTNEHVERILEALGTHQKADSCGQLNTVNGDGRFVCCLGDDAWGAVTAIATWNGHLILVANFGDDGDYIYSPTATSMHQMTEVENDLPYALRNALDSDHALTSDDLWINPLREYSIGVSFSC